MAVELPDTSSTLLRNLACDTQHARWGEFVERYRPMMVSYLHTHFPMLDADDIIQETLIALIKIFPVYHYCPNEKGSFHNYLVGIIRNKALKLISKKAKQERRLSEYAQNAVAETPEEQERKLWRESLMEVALQQLLADNSIHGRTREVFTRIAVNGEDVDAVAKSFGITCNAAYQMKNRMVTRLRVLVAALEKVNEEQG